MNVLMNAFVMFIVGTLLHAGSLHAMSADTCNQVLEQTKDLVSYLSSDNRKGYKDLCTLYGMAVDLCKFKQSDKKTIQESYDTTCQSVTVQFWLNSSGNTLTQRRLLLFKMTLASIVAFSKSRIVM